MNCKTFRDNIADLFDCEVKNQDLLNHIDTCDKCKKYYEEWAEIINMLTPHHAPSLDDKIALKLITPKHAPTLTEDIARKARIKSASPRVRFLRSWRQMVAVMFVFLLGLSVGLSNFFSSSAVASDAIRLLDRSLIGIQNVGNFSMKLQVRTYPNENFYYISSDAPFVEHSLKVSHIEGQTVWRLEKKSGRTLVCDGQKQFLWNERYPKASIHSLTDNIGAGFMPFIKPYILFEYEKKMIEKSSSDSYTVSNTDSTTILTIYATHRGNPHPLLWKNHSMEESDNIREYVFDKQSGLLKQIHYWILIDDKRVLILESEQILYNRAINQSDITRIPTEGYEWVDKRKALSIDSKRLAFLQQESPQEASIRILTALFTGNRQNAREALINYDMNDLIESWKSYRLISCTKTLHSDGYRGIYAIMEVLNPKNKQETIMLALRNDNPDKIWMIDGGL